MVVYQALKRLTGFAQVATVLDECGHPTWRDGYSNNEESESNDGVENVYTSDTLLGKVLHTPVMVPDGNEAEQLDTESVTRYVRRGHDNKRCKELLYFRHKVTWLNYSPGSKTFKELAVAFATVSFVIMKLSRRVRSVIDRFLLVRKSP